MREKNLKQIKESNPSPYTDILKLMLGWLSKLGGGVGGKVLATEKPDPLNSQEGGKRDLEHRLYFDLHRQGSPWHT